MSRENEINEMLKEFPLKVRYGFLQKRYGHVRYDSFLSYDVHKLSNGMDLLVEMGTWFLYGVLTSDKFYQVDSIDGEYVVVNVVDSVQWFNEWMEIVNGGKDNE